MSVAAKFSVRSHLEAKPKKRLIKPSTKENNQTRARSFLKPSQPNASKTPEFFNGMGRVATVVNEPAVASRSGQHTREATPGATPFLVPNATVRDTRFFRYPIPTVRDTRLCGDGIPKSIRG
jgi:hypothetical protein